jgi:DNA-binding NtrC family response regulator
MTAPAHRLLIVDDEEIVRRLLARYFTKAGFLVDTAANVAEALSRLTADHRLALCDIRMPDLDGIDLLRAIHARCPDTGVFLMTGYPTLENIIDAGQHGAAGCFVKPISPAEIVARMQEYLEGAARPTSPEARCPA